MGKATLVESDITDGRELIEALKQAGFPIRAALWFYFSESEVWRLMIATPLVDEQGPKEAYTRIQSVLASLPRLAVSGSGRLVRQGISLTDTTVVGPKDNIIRLLRKISRKGPVEARYTRIAIDNTYIDDVYIYFTR
jgi:hypothetical protein